MIDPEPPRIVVENVSHFFGRGEARTQVLYDINLTVLPGELVLLTGPPGAGRSTLLTLLGGLRTVQQGKIRVLGPEFHGLNAQALAAVRRRIGFVLQRPRLLEALTAYQNVKAALDLTSPEPAQDHDHIVELLTDLGLAEHMHHKPALLTAGQRQGVAVARALAGRPHLVLADEPTATLDAEACRAVVRRLRALAKGPERCAGVIVTQDPRVLDVADRIVRLAEGRVTSDVVVTESVLSALFLSKCPMFAGLTPDALTRLADCMAVERHPAGAMIYRQGDRGDKFYLIRRGAVEVVTERTGAWLREGDFFGERALVSDEPRNATAVACEEVETYTLARAHFREVLAASASLKEELLKTYFQRG